MNPMTKADRVLKQELKAIRKESKRITRQDIMIAKLKELASKPRKV